MDSFWCNIISGSLELKEAEDAKWLTKDTIESVNWLQADLELVEKIKKEL